MRYKVINFVRYKSSKSQIEGVLLECVRTKVKWITTGRYWFKAIPGIIEDYEIVDSINLNKFMDKFNKFNVHGSELIFK